MFTILRERLKRMSKIYLCSPKEFDGVESLPTIEFKRVVDSLELDRFDSLLFTSKQAILYSEELNPSWRDKKILAVGEATRKLAKELGAKDIYSPKNYYGKELAKDIVRLFFDKKILYIRPKIISFNSKEYLAKFGINIEEKIIYETKCKEYKEKNLQKDSIIIFTSPSTIRCFFKSFKWDRSFKAVVIGSSTLDNIPNEVEKVYIANRPTIKSCIEKAIEIERNLKKM